MSSTMSRAMLQKCAKIAALAARDHTVVRPMSTFLPPLSSVSSSRAVRGMSTFTPATPAKTKGTPVFKDVNFTIAKDPLAECAVRNADPKAVFIVTGANRGLGLEFVKQLVHRTKGTIVACCRSPDSATALKELVSSLDDQSRVEVVSLDVEDQDSIERAGSIIKGKFGRVDMLLNNAGILGDAKTTPGPERALSGMDRDWLEKTMAVNLTGPVMLSKELVPLMMQRRKKKKSPEDEARAIAVIANVSAGVGSISDNEIGGWYSYRMSKAALNQATRTMALELKRQSTWTVALYPGMADTDLSKPFQSKNMKEGFIKPVDFTVEQLLNIIDSMDEDSTGGFYDWSGQALSF